MYTTSTLVVKIQKAVCLCNQLVKREAQVGSKIYSHTMCTNVMVHLLICTCSVNEEVSAVCHKHTAAGDGCAGPGKSVC